MSASSKTTSLKFALGRALLDVTAKSDAAGLVSKEEIADYAEGTLSQALTRLFEAAEADGF